MTKEKVKTSMGPGGGVYETVSDRQKRDGLTHDEKAKHHYKIFCSKKGIHLGAWQRNYDLQSLGFKIQGL